MFISYVFYFYWSVNFHSKVGLEEIPAVKRDFLVFYFFFVISSSGTASVFQWPAELYSWPDECELTQLDGERKGGRGEKEEN